MQKIKRYIVLFMLLSLVSGCAGRPGQELLRGTVTATRELKIVTLYVATTRQRNEAGEFTSGRARELSYIRFKVSIPPIHKSGNIEWPKRSPDPKKHFVTVEQKFLDQKSFETEATHRRGSKAPNVGVFVHGYNTNFPEAVYRLAQMTADAGSTGEIVPILFAWPSEGTVAGYVADKDAATFSRDQLVQTLTMLSKKTTAGRITVFGHSMGGWLTMEAVRQLRLDGKDAVIRRLQIILAAPDIDVDVFGAQMDIVGPLDPPMTILVSKDDRALRISEILSTSRQRVGRIDVMDPVIAAASKKAKIQIVDITELQTSDTFKHDGFVSLFALHPQLTGRGTGTPPDLRQAGAFVFNAVSATLSSPFLLAGRVVGGQ